MKKFKKIKKLVIIWAVYELIVEGCKFVLKRKLKSKVKSIKSKKK